MIFITKEAVEQFKVYSKDLTPYEACGLLVSNEETQIIDTFIPIRNISINPRQFQFDPKAFIQNLNKLENTNKKWVGVIHSHPNTNAFPSHRDIENWFYSHLSYWIYSLPNDDLQAYFIRDKKTERIDFNII